MFLYVKLQKPVLQYESKTEYEYVVDCVVDEDTADAFEDCADKFSVKKIKTAIFEKTFDVAPPFPEQKNQYKLKLRAYSHYPSGDLVPYEYGTRPKVYVPNGKLVTDVTLTYLVGNGSMGDLSFQISKSEFGSSAKVTGILVKDLIVYESNEGMSAFGEVSNADEAKAQFEASQPAPTAKQPVVATEAKQGDTNDVSTAAKTLVPEATILDDDDIPF